MCENLLFELALTDFIFSADSNAIFLIWQNLCILFFLKLKFASLRPKWLTVLSRQLPSGMHCWMRQEELESGLEQERR